MNLFNVRLLRLVMVLLLMGGCATVDEPPPIDFLQNGVTSRDVVIRSMGNPAMFLEYASIVTYRMKYDKEKHQYQVIERQWSGSGGPGWKYADISLVLIFNQNGILETHSIVEVK